MSKMNLIKRSGREEVFEQSKIEDALRRASMDSSPGEQLSEDLIRGIAAGVESECAGLGRAVTVDEVQAMVERRLMEAGAYDIARKYITYRYKLTLRRRPNTTDKRILSLVESGNEDVKQENANKNPTVNSVQRDYMAGEVSKDISARILLPPDVVDAHNSGVIHFHDMDYYAQRMHNCFTGGTKFITDRGIREFKDFNDGEKVVVKDMFGELREATVHLYGDRKMQRVTLKNPKMQQEVICTPDHRWILHDGTVTTNLKVGDRLWRVVDSSSRHPSTSDELRSWCIGFSVGDGCDVSSCGIRIRLCGAKNSYAPIFDAAGWSLTKQSVTGEDTIAYKGRISKQDFLSGRAWRFMPASLQAMVFRGLYAADGATKAGRISTADDRVAELIRDTAGLAGYFVSSEVESIRDTPFKKGARLITFHLVTKQPENWAWKVVKIEKETVRPAYCVEEPITHTFTLDKGIVTGNCDLVNLDDMLQNGTVISGTMIERPKSFSTACNIATQIIAQVASNQYGGQSISLTHLAPFVEVSRQAIRKELNAELDSAGVVISDEKFDEIVEGRVRTEIKKGVQTIQYQVVTLMTTNGQAPFITVFMYLGEAKDEKERKDLAMVIEETLRQRIQGVKNESGAYITPAFPKLIYVLEESNVKEGTQYWYLTELAAKCTAKRMVPDYISEKKMKEYKLSKGETEGNGDCYTCMGCRSFLTPDRSGDGFGNISNAGNYVPGKPKYYGRFNQGVVTINLVDVALSAHGDEEKFWKIFGDRCELCHKALRCRHERLLGTTSDAAPILWQHGALARLKKGEKIDKLLYGGYSTISLGYAGLWECVYSMTGKKLTEPEGEKFGLEVMKKLNEYTAKWKAAEDIDYSLYGTPLESTTYKFAKCLQDRFGVIKGVTDKNYITNSYHVHVTEKIDAFDKLALEAKFQKLSPGGAISYVEVPDMQHNIKAVLSIMQFIYDNIMYAELNTKSDYCQECGFNGEIQIVEDDHGKLIWKCPNCGNTDQSKMNVARRTCGYIGSQYWNQGRTQEIKDRVLHVS